MADKTTWMLPILLVLLAAVGCAPQQPEPLGQLVTPHVGLQPMPQPNLRGRLANSPEHDKSWQTENPRPWKYIVIHHSATNSGSAKSFDASHRGRGFDELGYHFVITNGSGGPDGTVQVGSRWTKQKHGAHCGGTPENEYNELGIGICLVGDFSKANPTKAQSASLAKLIEYLTWRFEVPPTRIIGHCQAPKQHTNCPGSALLGHVVTHWQKPDAATVAKAQNQPETD